MTAGSPFVPGKAADLAFDSDANAITTTVADRLDQQILADTTLLNAVTTDTEGSYSTVADKKRLTAYVYCTGGTATLEMMGKPNSSATAIALPIKDSVSNSISDSLALTAGTNYVVTLDGEISVAEIAAKVSSVTGATVTVILIGGAL